MPTIRLVRPHGELQRQLITYPGNVAAFCGRRWGKTEGLVQRVFYHLARTPGLYWWVGLSWQAASMKRAWALTVKIAEQFPGTVINKSSHEVAIPGLGQIWFRTAENPSSLAGEGIKGAVLDEFSLMREEVWTEYVQGTLLDHGGWAAFGGVPKGHNWAAALYDSAADKEGWLQIKATTYDNPFIDPALIDKIKSDPNTPSEMFNQEYMAEVVSLEGAVFKNVVGCIDDVWLDNPEPRRDYVAGVDIGDANDYTVIVIMDMASKEVVHVDRFRKSGFPNITNRIATLTKQWRLIDVCVESNSIGQPVIDYLWERDVPVTPFTTSRTTKTQAIQELQAALEFEQIKIPNHKELVAELMAYESKQSGFGYQYSAPAGKHDDCVMALALAWHRVNNYRPAVY